MDGPPLLPSMKLHSWGVFAWESHYIRDAWSYDGGTNAYSRWADICSHSSVPRFAGSGFRPPLSNKREGSRLGEATG